MKYLLDVNALIALGFEKHEFHDRISRWITGQRDKGTLVLATTPITELGFLRVLSQIKGYNISLKEAAQILLLLKQSEKPAFAFLSDDQNADHLPRWVRKARQTTDGHLLQLATAKGYQLLTFDKRIPGGFIPD